MFSMNVNVDHSRAFPKEKERQPWKPKQKGNLFTKSLFYMFRPAMCNPSSTIKALEGTAS